MSDDGVVFNDDYVHAVLRPVAAEWTVWLDPTARRKDVRADLEAVIASTRTLFRQHRGFVGDDDVLELKLLNTTLDIVGLVLNLKSALPVFERVIEVDWRAHLDLRKEKRYRDHITHPARVTAIGWWLLHRDDHALLDDLAAHYERVTHGYRLSRRISVTGQTWPMLVQYAWLAAGLLHDTLYPAEYHLRAGTNLRECACDPMGLLGPARRRFQLASSRGALLRPLEGSWFVGALRSVDHRLSDLATTTTGFKHCHALLGALHHLRSLGDRLHTLQGLVVQMAARAIATHHDKEDGDILADPLALLLYVADNLQAWNRPFLHLVPASPGSQIVRPLVECKRIELRPDGPGYRAEYWMNDDDADMALLRGEPYGWRFEHFAEPQRALEAKLATHSAFPRIVLSEPECVRPERFLSFMKP